MNIKAVSRKTSLLAILLLSILAIVVAASIPNGLAARAATEVRISESHDLYNVLSFDIHTGDYVPGTYARVAQGFPVITIELTGVSKTSTVKFQYVQKESVVSVDEIEQQSWITLQPAADWWKAELNLGDIVGGGFRGLFSGYFYFRTLIEDPDGMGYNYYYVRPNFIDVLLDCSDSSTNFGISWLAAYYIHEGVETVYNTDVPNPQWVNTQIIFKAKGLNPTQRDTMFFYSLDEGVTLIPFDVPHILEPGQNEYVGVAVLNQSFMGEVEFYVCDIANTSTTKYIGGRFYVRIDTVVPEFIVSATTVNRADPAMPVEPYDSNKWANSDVQYTLTRKPGNEGLSGLVFMVRNGSTNPWVPIAPQPDGTFIYVVEQTTRDLRFKAVNDAGREYNPGVNYATYISKVEPEISVVAVDNSNTPIRSMGSAPGVNYRVGYAADSINFTITNLNPETPVGSNPIPRITVEYAIRETDANGETVTSEFTEINEIMGTYSLGYTIGQNTPPFKNRTYIFRMRTQAGFSDTEEFTVSVLKSNFSFAMAPLDYLSTNSQGWVIFEGRNEAEIDAAAQRGVPIYLYIESFLGTEDEFEFYSFITSDETIQTRITDFELDESYQGENGVKRYIVYIKQTLNNQSVSFYVINKAGAASPALATPMLKLDAAKPLGDVSKKVGGVLELYPGEWSSTSVQIQITPKARIIGQTQDITNISGVTCYPLLGGGSVLGQAIQLRNGFFSQTVSATGLYSFRLVSGAGIYTDIHVQVNIDTSAFGQITENGMPLPWISVETLAEGLPIEIALEPGTTDRYRLVNKTAESLRILFNTTHGSHITYEWAIMVNNVPPSANDFVRVPNPDDIDQAFLFELARGATGTVTYVFNINSKAKNTSGVTQNKMGIVLTIEYDSATFSIRAETDQQPGRWTKDDIRFTLIAPNDVTVKKYQIKLEDETYSNWMDITVVNGVYTFSGLERFINRAISPSIAEEVERRSYGYSYNGRILFRAISDAGMASEECDAGIFMIDKIDPIETSEGTVYGMHPLNAFYQQTGDYMIDSNGVYHLYSNTSVKIEPALLSSRNAVRDLFAKKSAVSYYYAVTDSGSSTAPSQNDPSVRLVDASTSLASGWYWVFAHNTTFNIRMTAKFSVHIEPAGALSAQFDHYDDVGASDKTSPDGLFMFSWSNIATVLITPDSDSPVYFWYKIGAGGAWQKFDPTAGPDNSDSTRELTFVGEETANTAEYINRTDVIKAGNINSTVQFRVTNLAGNVYDIDTSVVVRIDDSEPTFRVTLLSTDLLGRDITIDADNADELNKWYPNAVQIILTPMAVNPGGVTYKYQEFVILGGTAVPKGNLEKLPGNGTNFTTDDLSIFQDKDGYVNGQLNIFIVATATAATKDPQKKTFRKQLTIKIDKTVPEFSLRGRVTINGVERNIGSGEWTNSPSGVMIIRDVPELVRESMENASGVTYEYSRNGSVKQRWETNTLTENSISSYVFTATTGAGRTYVRNFEVRIDTQPPIIISGYIEQNTERIETYYIDQVIRYEEDNLKYAKYNDYPLTNGQVIAPNTVDPTNGGYVHIIIEDLAGNKAELKFYMTVFPLNVNTVTLSEEHRNMVLNYEAAFLKARSGLQSSRQEYFEAYIARLWDRIATLEKMRDDYRAFLVTVNSRQSFNLQDDYPEMYKYINYFITDDYTIRYPQWLQDEIRSGVYDTYYLKLESEYAKLRTLMATVEAVQEDVAKLPATNVVQRSHYQSILRVYNAYESLSTDQKSVFKDTLYTKLLELKRKCEVLLLQDESTGISIDGKDLAAGVAIEVMSYAKTTELFNNAQLVLLETVGSDEAIVSIHKLSLSGYGSQQNTGTVTITLPIPDEYYDYIYFSVYRLSSDGTLTPIRDTTISGDGRSVYFTDNKLDTYVLATRGNIRVREPSEKIYGKIGNIEVDGTLLSYITYVSVSLFAVLLVIMIIMGIKHKSFFRKYNKAYRNSLKARGLQSIPKGNAPAPTYPNDPTTVIDYSSKIYDKNK